MRLQLRPQHRADVREVDRLLRNVVAQDANLVRKFPRPLTKVISLGHDAIRVCFESRDGLDAGVIARILRDKYRLKDVSLNEDDSTPLAGYLYAVGTSAFIFSDPQYGEQFERFTIAHEAGHLFLEFVPQVDCTKQRSLFDPPPKPAVVAARDTPKQLHSAFDATNWDEEALLAEYQRRKEALREKRANGFAAELLAPFDEVKRLVGLNAELDYEGYVNLIRSYFHISKAAAGVRLAELAETEHPNQQVFKL